GCTRPATSSSTRSSPRRTSWKRSTRATTTCWPARTSAASWSPSPDRPRVTKQVVGRQRELELVRAALASGAHILLEGPPGTGKSTLLRQGAGGRAGAVVSGGGV